MGVKPTPTNFKTFTFDGENSRSYGVYITGEGVFNAPERNVEMVEIPGRNGAFALDKGNFNNIEVTYPAGIFADTETDFAEAVSDLRNFLCSRVGYVRLEDDYNPNEYRLAVYKSGLDVEHDFLIAGEFELVFECKPQRFLKSGETPITIGEWGETETYTGAIAQFENPNGWLAVKSLTADIEPLQDLHGYSSPWVGGAGKNLFEPWSTTYYGITFTPQSDGTVSISGTTTSAGWIQPYKEYNIADFGLSVGDSVYCYSKGNVAGGNEFINFARFYDGNGTTLSTVSAGQTGTVPTGAVKVRMYMYGFGSSAPALGTVVNKVGYFEFGKGSTLPTQWTPWENLCPITGWTGCEVDVSGVNVWDEEWEVGSISGQTGQSTSGSYVRSTNYISVKPNTIYYFNRPTGNKFWLYAYDENKNYLHDAFGTTTGYYTLGETTYLFTIPNGVYYIRFVVDNNYGTTYNNDISINYPSTDHEYHAYNGTTYPVSWQTEAGTVYGGTVDLVTGVLTATMPSNASIDLGSLNWYYEATVPRFYSYSVQNVVKKPPKNSVKANALCDRYQTVPLDGDESLYSGIDQSVAISAGGVISVRDENYTNASDFKTAVTGSQLVYELTTPTTYQLDPVQVACLLGHNNVWNNVGDTSIEVGNDPNYVINPTRFEAQPQFQVKGYGTFDIDGAQINVDNSALGSIISPIEPTDHTGWDNFSGTFEGFLFGNGDTVALQGKKVYCSFTHYANGSISSFSVGNAIGCSVINMSSVEPYSIEVIIPDSTFVIGTSTRISTAKFDIAYTATVNGTTTSQTVTVTFYTDYYQSVNTISHSINLSAPLTGLYKSMKTITGNVVGVSSKTITGTKYIDLDIGEAWAIESGRQIPLNSVVQIPAELPTLKSGANTITYDNTFTQFDIVPRWWSV